MSGEQSDLDPEATKSKAKKLRDEIGALQVQYHQTRIKYRHSGLTLTRPLVQKKLERKR
jgi:hypothetical protein